MGVDGFFSMLRGKIPEEPRSPEEVSEDAPEGLGVHVRKVPTHHHHQVDSLRHLIPVQAYVLAKPSLEAIPDHRPAETAGNGEAQPPP